MKLAANEMKSWLNSINSKQNIHTKISKVFSFYDIPKFETLDIETKKDLLFGKKKIQCIKYEEKSVDETFVNKIIGQVVLFYVVTSFLLGFISYSIASSSWENDTIKWFFFLQKPPQRRLLR